MKNLLELALEVHGGLTRWSQLKAVTADLSVTGALWQIKGQAGTFESGHPFRKMATWPIWAIVSGVELPTKPR
jgi:hypothetical protein